MTQKSPLGTVVWMGLAALVVPPHHIHLQWVPSRCSIDGNQRADQVAKEAATLPKQRSRWMSAPPTARLSE